jgi:CRISPR-associated exonuclease Cas4
MYAEDSLLPLSALQHLMFCERQCALIHIEQAWAENRLTAEGRVMHERVHELDSEKRGEVRIARGLRIRSLELGLIGQADVVEFHAGRGTRIADGELQITERPFPIEYKRGKPKADVCDEIQLCAQALCLEEMLGTAAPDGAIFYGQTRRRHDVTFTPELRQLTADTARRLHELVDRGVTPPAVYEKKCEACSLKSLCLPQITKSAKSYLRSVICN